MNNMVKCLNNVNTLLLVVQYVYDHLMVHNNCAAISRLVIRKGLIGCQQNATSQSEEDGFGTSHNNPRS